jgi:hypothetical protein
MTGRVLSCQEVFTFFSREVGHAGGHQRASEGAQNAFVNLYHRLEQHCPGERCEQLAECILYVDGEPKTFDGVEGKLRFLRMKVRTEGRRLHRRGGNDALAGGHAALVGDDDWRLGGDREQEPGGSPTEAVEVERALDDALAGLRARLEGVDLSAVRGGYENVAVAAAVVAQLIELTESEPVPSEAEERRETVRRSLTELAPRLVEGAPAAVRQRHKRLREIMRVLLDAADGSWLAEVWVPPEPNKRR